MSIELLYRIQKSFNQGYGIRLYFQKDSGKWESDYTEGGNVDWLSPEGSLAYYNWKKQAGFIVYKEVT